MPNIAELPAGIDSYVLPAPSRCGAKRNISCGRPTPNIGAARAEPSQGSRLPGLLGFASSALLELFTGGAFGWSAGANANYTIFQAGAGHANVGLPRLSATLPSPITSTRSKSAFRDVSDALARRATMEYAADGGARASRPAASDNYLLTEARYGAGGRSVPQRPHRSARLLHGAEFNSFRSRRPPRITASTSTSRLAAIPDFETAPVCGVDYVSQRRQCDARHRLQQGELADSTA